MTSDASGGNMTPSYALRSAFGERLAPDQTGGGPGSQTGSLTTEYAFGGQPADAAIGLQYHRARWLDLGSSSWLSPDPIYDEKNYGNAFAFAGHNPLTHTDPSGLFTLNENTMVSGIMGELVRQIGFEVAGILLKATLSAAGLDPGKLLDPVLLKIADLFQLDVAISEFAQFVETHEDDIEGLLDIAAELIKIIQVVEIGWAFAQSCWSILQFFFNRGFATAFQATMQIWGLLVLLANFNSTIDLNMNPGRVFVHRASAPVDWFQNHFSRGNDVDGLLGNNLGNFPVIDKRGPALGLQNIFVSSIKSLDTTAQTYQNPGRLKSKMLSYARTMARYNRGGRRIQYGGHTVPLAGENITERIIEIAIPMGKRKRGTPDLTQNQGDAILQFIDQVLTGNEFNGLTVKIHFVNQI